MPLIAYSNLGSCQLVSGGWFNVGKSWNAKHTLCPEAMVSCVGGVPAGLFERIQSGKGHNCAGKL